ncbi:unnamed protein product [Durusdinium trenchii]|uniref:Uncharacterized protein n=1 Tax=Durusdinium trenchii TaxID=1381693 RepID=A0ABP0L748_9DINO
MKRSSLERLADEQTEIWYVQENPKRKGSDSWKRYEEYKQAKTVGEALQLGSWKGDLKHDFDHRFLHFKEVQGAAKRAAKARATKATPCRESKAVPAEDEQGDPIEDQGMAESAEPAEPSSSSKRLAQELKRRRSAPRQDKESPQVWKKLKSKGILTENDADEAKEDLPQSSCASQPGPTVAERRPASPLQGEQLSVADLCSRPSDFHEVLSEVEQNARDFARECGLPEEEIASTVEDESTWEAVSAEEPPAEEAGSSAAPSLLDWPEEELVAAAEEPGCSALPPELDWPDEEVLAAAEEAGSSALPPELNWPDEEVLAVTKEVVAPISPDSQDADAEEIRLRCRCQMIKVKQEVEESSEPSAKASPVAVPTPTGDLRQIFQQQRESQSRADAEEGNEEEENEDDDTAEKQAFESAQELSLEQNRSERQLRQQQEQDLLHQGSLYPLECLDQGLMDCIITSADLITWIESVENRVLLYEYLQLRAKAIAWYKEPAQAYFDGRRNVMLSSIEQPGASEVLAKFLEEEMATTKEALYDMPDKAGVYGVAMTLIMLQRLARANL